MKLLLTIFLLGCSAFAQEGNEIVSIELSDGEIMAGKLYLPSADVAINQVVIFVHGTGPGTYLNRRSIAGVDFNYFDVFGDEFNRLGIAFFSYNKRGVELGEQPPVFEIVDREKFKQVVPSVDVADLGTVIDYLANRPRLANAKVVLFGWSEGTIIAAMAAENPATRISALFLAGYAHENMHDIMKWQYSGASSMINLNPIFDQDGDGKISHEEYQSEDSSAAGMRAVMQNAKFSSLDLDQDGFLSVEDFRLLAEPGYKYLLDRIAAKDADWIWNNYFHVSLEWLAEHAELEANKTRLLRLNLPIYIFHGEDDPNTDVNGVRDLQKRFKKAEKNNLHAFIFAEHDHDLHFLQLPIHGHKSPAIKKIFEIAAELNG